MTATASIPDELAEVPLRLWVGVNAVRTDYARDALIATWKLLRAGWCPLDLHPDDYERYVALHEGPHPWTERYSGRLLDQTGPPSTPDMFGRPPAVCAVGWCDHDDHTGDDHHIGDPTPDWMLTPHRFAEHWSIDSGEWAYEADLHHICIGERLGVQFQRGGGRIRISMPSQTGKSATVGYAVLLGYAWSARSRFVKQPARNILASYEKTIAGSFGRTIRNQLDTIGDDLNIPLRHDSTSVSQFAISTVHGDMTYSAAGMNGSITGRPATFAMIVDDAFKGWVDAQSDVQRDTVHQTYRAAARTRVHPGCCIALIGTRFHEDDLIGRVADDDSGDWEVVVITAIAEPGDVLGREPGQPLWESSGRTIEFWEDLADDLGPYLAAAILQGSPTAADGEIFKRDGWQYVDEVPSSPHLRYVRRWDFAASKKKTSDETVGALVARDASNGYTYIVNVIHKRLEPDGVEQLVEDTANTDVERLGRNKVAIRFEQEPGASGKGWPDSIIRTRLNTLAAEVVPSKGDKYERMRPFSAVVARGHCFIVKVAGRIPEWAELLIDQAAAVPTGRHDDVIDAVNLAHMDLVEIQPKARRARASSAAGTRLPSKP